MTLYGYFDAIAVAFEQAGGRLPEPIESEAFELTITPIQ